MADSPMERAVRALGGLDTAPIADHAPLAAAVSCFIKDLRRLRTSDPDAFAAVVAELGRGDRDVPRLLAAVRSMTELPSRLSQATIDGLPSVWWEKFDALCEAYEPVRDEAAT